VSKPRKPPRYVELKVSPHSDPEKRAATGCMPCLMMTFVYLTAPAALAALLVKGARRG
jgi:hypothetical protein